MGASSADAAARDGGLTGQQCAAKGFERPASGYLRDVDVRAASRRVLRAERKVLRVQRRLWLAQVLFWPAVLALAILAVVSAWKFRQRSAQRRSHVSAVTSAPTDETDAPVTGSGTG
jgi:hypothetical protein